MRMGILLSTTYVLGKKYKFVVDCLSLAVQGSLSQIRIFRDHQN